MDFSRFFIDRPIFAAVLSIVIFVAGAIAIPLLPISEYPEVVPPTVVVQATYPGANPKVIAETVSSPLEEQINGVENMMYMKSVAGSDGVLQMTITFAPGTDPNKAQVDVQNRVSQALSRLPSEVVSLGVTTQKQSPAFLTLITLISDGKYDPLYLRNYANIRVKDQLARIPGVGQIRLFGGGDYAMRIWLDPDKIASRGLTAGDVVRADPGAEHPGLGRPARRRTDQGRQRFPDCDQRAGPPAHGGGVRRHRAEDRLERRGRAPFRRRAHRAWRQRLHPAWPARPLQHGHHRHVPGARRQRAGDAGRGDREDGRARQAVPARRELPIGL